MASTTETYWWEHATSKQILPEHVSDQVHAAPSELLRALTATEFKRQSAKEQPRQISRKRPFKENPDYVRRRSNA
eukprot:38809-Eustigmatos_ZCMA.PRE.1